VLRSRNQMQLELGPRLFKQKPLGSGAGCGGQFPAKWVHRIRMCAISITVVCSRQGLLLRPTWYEYSALCTTHCEMAGMDDGEEVVVEALQATIEDRVGLEPGRIHRIDRSPDSRHPQPSPERSKGHRRPGTDLTSGKAWSSQGPVEASTDCFSGKTKEVGCRGIQFCHSRLACLLHSWKRLARGGLCGQAQTNRIRPEQPGGAPGVFLASGLTTLPGHDAHCESL
jgi:hypothetical protein